MQQKGRAGAEARVRMCVGAVGQEESKMEQEGAGAESASYAKLSIWIQKLKLRMM